MFAIISLLQNYRFIDRYMNISDFIFNDCLHTNYNTNESNIIHLPQRLKNKGYTIDFNGSHFKTVGSFIECILNEIFLPTSNHNIAHNDHNILNAIYSRDAIVTQIKERVQMIKLEIDDILNILQKVVNIIK